MNRFLSPNQNKQLWLSLLLFSLCYGVFGWLFAEGIPHLTSWLLEQSIIVNLPLSTTSISGGIKFLSILFIVIITIALIAPFQLISICFGDSLKSEKKAFFSLLIGTSIVILLVCWFELFVRLSVLFSAGILVRLDLQYLGYNKSQSFLILLLVALTSLWVGLFAFYWFNLR